MRGPVTFPIGVSWTSSWSYYEVELPTFTSQEPLRLPTSEPEKSCFVDPEDSSAEFYLLDQTIGYLSNRNGRPGHPEPPTSQAEANAMAAAPFNSPLYRFEKPTNGPDRLYDLVLTGSTTKLYVTKKANSAGVVFTESSTGGQVADGLVTTIFSVSCKGYMTARHASVDYIWRDTEEGTKEGTELAPRCLNYPQQVEAFLKDNARPSNSNGCGPANGVDRVPDWKFGSCCDGHDNCFDDCGETFERCNDVFHGCMKGKCYEVLNSWLFWLFWACQGMADFYAFMVGTSIGVEAFNTANGERWPGFKLEIRIQCPSSSFLNLDDFHLFAS
ncbi:hypothetical protein ACJ41O_013989 [Fusarium nematophilum]